MTRRSVDGKYHDYREDEGADGEAIIRAILDAYGVDYEYTPDAAGPRDFRLGAMEGDYDVRLETKTAPRRFDALGAWRHPDVMIDRHKLSAPEPPHESICAIIAWLNPRDGDLGAMWAHTCDIVLDNRAYVRRLEDPERDQVSWVVHFDLEHVRYGDAGHLIDYALDFQPCDVRWSASRFWRHE